MEASAIPANVGLARTRLALGAPLLRLRSDEQLVTLFRSGSEEAFRAIHDRYRQRLFAYTRQMLSGSPIDPEDTVQEIFVRAYGGLRSSDRELALRAWLYRIAHNRCIDELRRPQPVVSDTALDSLPVSGLDPVARVEQRDALARLIADVQRLPEQQRSALLMRELGGMTYADVAGALGVSVPAIKSLLVRARVGLAQASEARDTSCARIREDLIVAHDRGVRASGLARRHMRDCSGCREFRTEVRGVSRQLAAFVPALGPIGVLAKVLGIGGAGGGAAGGTAMAGGGAGAATGATASVGAIAGGHVVTILAAAVVTAGGAIELNQMAPPHTAGPAHHHHVAARRTAQSAAAGPTGSGGSGGVAVAPAQPAALTTSSASATSAATPLSALPAATSSTAGIGKRAAARRHAGQALTLPETVDPDNLPYLPGGAGSNGTVTGTGAAGSSGSSTAGTQQTAAGTAADGTGQPVSSSTATSAPPSSSTGATTGTAQPVSTGTGASPAAAGSSSTSSTGTAGSSGDTGATKSASTLPVSSRTSPTPAAKVTPATSRRPSPSSAVRSGSRSRAGKREPAVAVFTVTGN